MDITSARETGLQRREVVRNLIAERSCLRQELNSVLSQRFWDLEQADDGYSIDTESWRDDELPALVRRLEADVSAAAQLRLDPSRARCEKCERSLAKARA